MSDALFTKLQAPGDAKVLRELQAMFEGASLAEIQRFCEGTMNALVVVQDTFRRRFPREWESWNAQFEDPG